jgi:hypothetical protein
VVRLGGISTLIAPVIWVAVNFDFFMFLQKLNVNNSVYFSTVGFLGRDTFPGKILL